MSRFKLVLALFGLLVLTAGVAGGAYYWEKFVRPEKEVQVKMVAIAKAEEKPDLGRKHYLKAVDFIGEGELLSARNELQYLLDVFPESPSLAEAKRVLGEVNLDLILSKIPLEGKSEYVVKKGDALTSIARKNQTTIDYIMRANGKITTVIYPNESLTVFPLACEAVIDLEKSTLTLYEGTRFIKEYRLQDIQLPTRITAAVSTVVTEKVAWHDGRSVDFTHDQYFNSQKWIRTGRNGLFIRQFNPEQKETDAAGKAMGVMVAREDLEEIYTILRIGTPVRVVPKST